ncbi:MAG: hypothetical protein RRZ24_03770 [Clostridia bacterium]
MFQRQKTLDELNRTLLIVGLICSISGVLLFSSIAWLRMMLTILATACLVYAVIRLLGGNPEKRYQENMKFLTMTTGVRDWFHRIFHKDGTVYTGSAQKEKTHRARKARKNPTWSEIKQYKYFICPQCAQRLRVPRGKGKLRVTCTHCGNKFETKS